MEIDIKTPIRVHPTYAVKTHEVIVETNPLWKRVLGFPKVKKRYTIGGSPVFQDKIILTILDEIDAKAWMQETYKTASVYKKNLNVLHTDGTKYQLLGAFPVQIQGSEVTFCMDAFVIIV